ncbi:MerR family transcriptional regulator [Marinactinospora rubrisoli]|uniref:MerR family transcriptional regulator n=1 Tax=Marinactinospora rubrisoli TaxID=2715399 RepID=A0ABW2K9D5_9ACTN
MRIGEVAAKAGVSVRALRYYEEQGLLMPSRTPAGQRSYPESAVDRVRLIQHFYAAGLTSRAILELLPCIDSGAAAPEMLDRLAEERDRIDRQVQELLATRDRLDGVIAAAERPGPDCRYD